MWALEHVLFAKTKGQSRCAKFPRILFWKDVKFPDSGVASTLQKNLVSLLLFFGVYNMLHFSCWFV